MGSSVTKYLEENEGHFGNKIKEIAMSDREIMDAKYPDKKIKNLWMMKQTKS